MPTYTVETPFGWMSLSAEAEKLTELRLNSTPSFEKDTNSPLLSEAVQQLLAYCAGTLSSFDLPLHPQGTPFMLRVWEALQEIPYGETTSYGEIAHRIGIPRASRAVGLANNKNPLPIFIPCHRVIGRNGKLTGYGGGLELKQLLLELEFRNKHRL